MLTKIQDILKRNDVNSHRPLTMHYERVAKKLQSFLVSTWIRVEDFLPEEESEVAHLSIDVLVWGKAFDERDNDFHKGFYDFEKEKWVESSSGEVMDNVTDWRNIHPPVGA